MHSPYTATATLSVRVVLWAVVTFVVRHVAYVACDPIWLRKPLWEGASITCQISMHEKRSEKWWDVNNDFSRTGLQHWSLYTLREKDSDKTLVYVTKLQYKYPQKPSLIQLKWKVALIWSLFKKNLFQKLFISATYMSVSYKYFSGALCAHPSQVPTL